MTAPKKQTLVILTFVLLVLAYLFHWLDYNRCQNITLLLATFVAGFTILKKAIQSILMKVFSIELLVTIAVIGALLIGEYVESAAVTFLFLFGQYLEARTLEKTRKSIRALLDMSPIEATVLKDGNEVVLPVDEIEVGDHILVQSGGKIAVDGVIISGQAFVNQSAITGESKLAMKKQGDHVFSGTIIDNGYIEAIAEKVGDDTQFVKIIELVEEAQDTKAKTQHYLEKFASFYTPTIVVLAMFVYFFTQNVELTLTFLVIACPGALVISAPVSLVAGIGNGAKSGILIKGGEVIEGLAKMDVVVFDKTGTLTKGMQEITAIRTFGIDDKELLKIVAEVEKQSEHPLGKTIVREAEKRGISLTAKPTSFEVIKGYGVIAKLGNAPIIIGNRKLMEMNNVALHSKIDEYATLKEKQGYTVIFVGKDRKIVGILSIADQIRPDAFQAIQKLKQMGIKRTVMLTGDNFHTSAKVAETLGIDQVFAEMLPEDKVNQIEKLKVGNHRVGMVGDGINDAPALALADIGFAMGGRGTDVAMETADVVLMTDKLIKIPYAYNLAKATSRNMKQNMFFAVGTVGLLLIGVLLGEIFLASGMLIHELSVLIVILNALRLVRFQDIKNSTNELEIASL